MVQSEGGRVRSERAIDDSLYLTAAGRRRLEEHLAGDLAERDRLAPGDPNEVRDGVDEADRLAAADELARIDERIAATQSILARARPMPTGPEDGVVRLGSTVRVRDDQGESESWTLIDPVEFDEGTNSVAADSPVGSALLGHTAGDRVAVATPDGNRVIEILEVRAYRPD